MRLRYLISQEDPASVLLLFQSVRARESQKKHSELIHEHTLYAPVRVRVVEG